MALPTPIAYWPFDEASGTTAADASGNGHTATLFAGGWDTSALKKFGAAALANGSESMAAQFTPINLGTVHSVAFWMNGWNGSNDGITVGGNDQFSVGYLAASDFYYVAGTGNYVFWAHGGLTGSHHVVFTRNGTALVLYKDGTSLGSRTLGSNTAQTLSTMCAQLGGAFAFLGTIDDLRFYDVALSGAEVAELYALDPTAPTAVATAQAYVWGPL